MKIRNVIFDFGNVLIKWDPRNLYNNYFGDKEKADWFLKNIYTMDWNAKMDTNMTFAETESELIALYPEWTEAIRAYSRDWDQMIGGPITRMWDLIDQLKELGYKVYGLSNWPKEKIYPTIPLREKLDGAVISSLVKLAKPDEAIYHYLLNTYSLIPEECIFIDDTAVNIETAKKLGIHGIVFKDANTAIEELSEKLGIRL